jgi:hypothetical protein
MTVPSPTLDRIPITDCFISHSKIQPSEINDFSIIVFLNLEVTNEVLCKFYCRYQIN